MVHLDSCFPAHSGSHWNARLEWQPIRAPPPSPGCWASGPSLLPVTAKTSLLPRAHQGFRLFFRQGRRGEEDGGRTALGKDLRVGGTWKALKGTSHHRNRKSIHDESKEISTKSPESDKARWRLECCHWYNQRKKSLSNPYMGKGTQGASLARLSIAKVRVCRTLFPMQSTAYKNLCCPSFYSPHWTGEETECIHFLLQLEQMSTNAAASNNTHLSSYGSAAPQEDLFPCFFQILESPHIPQLVSSPSVCEATTPSHSYWFFFTPQELFFTPGGKYSPRWEGTIYTNKNNNTEVEPTVCLPSKSLQESFLCGGAATHFGWDGFKAQELTPEKVVQGRYTLGTQ